MYRDTCTRNITSVNNPDQYWSHTINNTIDNLTNTGAEYTRPDCIYLPVLSGIFPQDSQAPGALPAVRCETGGQARCP